MKEGEKIGTIVGESTTSEFEFMCDPRDFPAQWEYIVIDSQENIDGTLIPVKVLAQNMRSVFDSPTLTRELDLEALERLKRHDLGRLKIYGTARILGFFSPADADKREVLMPRNPLKPGQDVLLAPSKFLHDFFQVPEDEAIHLGRLISRPSVEVSVSVNGLRRHLAILAQTGGGKSYTTGVMIEELYDRGATVIIIDPHADYVLLNKDAKNLPRQKNICVFRNPNSSSRFTPEDMGGNVEPFTVQFGALSSQEVAELGGITGSNQLGLIEWAIDFLRIKAGIKDDDEEEPEDKDKHSEDEDKPPEKKDVRYMPKDLLELLERVKSNPKDPDLNLSETATKAIATVSEVITRVRRFKKRRVFGETKVPLQNFLKPQKISVIDLSGLVQNEQDYIVSYLLKEIYGYYARQDDPRPVFLFIEEAHNFVPDPKKKPTRSHDIINTIAAEGRKFGVFLVLVSQRPKKLDPDSLSQCNSQIILRITNPSDQRAIQESAERVSQDLLEDLPGLNVGEAILVGQITKIPIMAHIRKRQTKEGGRDIDVKAKLLEALKQAEKDRTTIKPGDKSERKRETNPFSVPEEEGGN